ncbi:MAG: glycosyltransferase [Rikenellaceae bacterium]
MKVSVIIPVYGVEKYIEKCARSLFEQTLEHIEYIFVDDCTVDNSIAILNAVLEQYPLRKPHVKIIKHKQNLGAAVARKNGIMAARGEYITHCDGDDWVDKDMYRAMYEQAKLEGLDLLTCGNFFIDKDGASTVTSSNAGSDKDKMLADIFGGRCRCSIALRLVKRSIFLDNDFIYPSYHMWEDLVLTSQIIYFSKKIGVAETPYYHYVYNPDSICNMDSDELCIKRYEGSKNNVALLISFLKSVCLYQNYEKPLAVSKLRVRYFLYPLLKKDNKYLKLWRQTYSELNYRFLLKESRLDFKNKLRFIITMLGLYSIINEDSLGVKQK